MLYSFKGGTTDGANPVVSRLIRDSSGNFYGTTSGGGTSGKGVVFKLALTGKETVLHNFKGGTTDGAVPSAGLIRDSAGDLYGTTLYGGASNKGVVFKLALTGKETVLHSFKGAPTDGENPASRLIRDSSGNFYGTTQAGGASNNGVVFKLALTGEETVLHSFKGGTADGAVPFAGVIRDSSRQLLRHNWGRRRIEQWSGVQAGFGRQGDRAALLCWGAVRRVKPRRPDSGLGRQPLRFYF